MRTWRHVLVIPVLLLVWGCYPGISGRVVEADTGQPISGAVVVAEWTMAGGLPGLTHHKVYKIVETETDLKGTFHLSGVYMPLVDEPAMVVFKKGYVPWRNDGDFEKAEDFKEVIWKDRETYQLKKLRDDHSRVRLDAFISSKFIGVDSQRTPRFQDVLAETNQEAREEHQRRKKMQGGGGQ